MPVGCVIYGFGYMGKIRHPQLKNNPHAGPIHIVDPESADANVLRSDAEIDWDQIGAVLVCTPNNVTADLCVKALQRKKHVFCEKPPGRNWDDFCRIADAAAASPESRLVFGFNHRLHPSVQAAKALIGKGGLGEVLYIKGTYGKSGGSRFKNSWRNNREISGGGILLDQGIHMLDLMHFFLGPLSVVDAVLSDAFWNCGVEDNAFVLMRSEQGTPVFLHSSSTLWKHTFRLEIGCADGYMVASGLLSQTGSYGREQLVIGKRQFEDEAKALGNPREEIIQFDRDDSWQKEVDEFMDAIVEHRPATHGTLEDARRAMQVVRDAYALADRQLKRVPG